MGYLPEAMRNYLLRLGWAHGDEEIIDTALAVKWFDLAGVGRSPSRFDVAKLENLNGHYMREADDERLLGLILPKLAAQLGHEVDPVGRQRLLAGMNGLKQRAKTLIELSDNALFYVARPEFPLANPKAAKLLEGDGASLLAEATARLAAHDSWDPHALETLVRDMAAEMGIGLGKIAQPLRAALTGSNASPGIFEIMQILGRDESLARLANAAKAAAPQTS